MPGRSQSSRSSYPCRLSLGFKSGIRTFVVRNVSTLVVVDRRRMPAERRHLHLHEGIERQARQDVVKLGVALDIKDADVRVVADDAPDVAPLAGTLELLKPIF